MMMMMMGFGIFRLHSVEWGGKMEFDFLWEGKCGTGGEFFDCFFCFWYDF